MPPRTARAWQRTVNIPGLEVVRASAGWRPENGQGPYTEQPVIVDIWPHPMGQPRRRAVKRRRVQKILRLDLRAARWRVTRRVGKQRPPLHILRRYENAREKGAAAQGDSAPELWWFSLNNWTPVNGAAGQEAAASSTPDFRSSGGCTVNRLCVSIHAGRTMQDE